MNTNNYSEMMGNSLNNKVSMGGSKGKDSIEFSNSTGRQARR